MKVVVTPRSSGRVASNENERPPQKAKSITSTTPADDPPPAPSTSPPARRGRRRLFFHKSRPVRHAHIRHNWVFYPVAVMQMAAQAIQCAVRGWLARRRVQAMRRPALVTKALQEEGEIEREERLVRRQYSFQSKYLRRTGATSLAGLRVYAATLIQAVVRGRGPRRRFQMIMWDMYHIAAAEIQLHWRRMKRRRQFSGYRPKPQASTAALTIQRAWRSHNNRRIFAYYKGLVAFKDKGDAAMMLKAVNPREAALLDLALGAHVRFRLGGPVFPPTVYYKIFTHRALVDVCAFAPRDYVAAQAAKPRADAARHLKEAEGAHKPPLSTESWYRRVENNDWRPVQVGALRTATQGAIPSRKTEGYIFHPSKLVRREDAERLKRSRRLQWLKDMYRTGLMAQARASASSAMADYQAQYGADFEVEEIDQEARDLLTWTDNLDFDAYVEEWGSIGTTARVDPLNLDLKDLPFEGSEEGGEVDLESESLLTI